MGRPDIGPFPKQVRENLNGPYPGQFTPGSSLDQFLVTHAQAANGRYLAFIHESDVQPLLEWCKQHHIVEGSLWALNKPQVEKEIQTTSFAHWLVQSAGGHLIRLTPFHPDAPLESSDRWSLHVPDPNQPELLSWPLNALAEEAERRRNQRFVKMASIWVLALLFLLGLVSWGVHRLSSQKLDALEQSHAVFQIQQHKKERAVEELNNLLAELQKYSLKREKSGELANQLRHIFNLCPPSTLLEDWQVTWDVHGWHMRGAGFTQNETLPSLWAGEIEKELPGFHSTISEVKRSTNLPANMLFRFQIDLEPHP